MKKPKKLRHLRYTASILPLGLLLGAVIALPAAATSGSQETGQHAVQEQGASEPGTMMADCQAMMAGREQMMEKRHAMDEKLGGLLGAVRSASGDAKIDAIEAVAEELVAQRHAMDSMMMEHHTEMMGHMMRHMGEGGDMKMCPMMKGMMPEGEPGKTEHSKHHP